MLKGTIESTFSVVTIIFMFDEVRITVYVRNNQLKLPLADSVSSVSVRMQ